MARTLDIDGLPSGLTLTCEVYAMGGNAVVETITLTERTIAKTNYTGTIVTASGADYKLGIKSGSSFIGSSTAYIGATDGVTYYTRQQSNLIEIEGTAQTARDIGASVIAASVATGGIVAASFAAGAIDAAAIATDAIGSAEIAASAVTKIQTGLATPTNITAGTITTASNVTTVNGLAAGVITAASIAADAITDAKVASDVTIASVTGSVGSVTAAITLPTIPADWITANGIAADAIGSSELAASAVTEIQAGLATSSAVTALGSPMQSGSTVVLTDASLTTAKLGTFALAKTTNITGFNDLSAAQVNTEADTALVDVGLTTTITGRVDAAISSRSSHTAADIWAVATRSLTTFGTLASDVWAVAARTLTTFAFTPTPSNAAETTAIKAKTDNLPSDPADQSAVEAAITSATSGLATEANATSNTTTITTAIGTRASQASVDDLPTNAELATALAAADDAVLARLGTPAGASVSADIAAVKVDTAATALDAAELNDTKLTTARVAVLSDWIDGGRLDVILDAILDDTGTSGVTLAASMMNKIADHMRRRTQANVEASSDGDTLSVGSLYGFIQQAQESVITGPTLSILKTDGATELGTKTLTSSASANPVTGIS